MKFNAVVFDVLAWAHADGNGEALQAMREYAEACNGKAMAPDYDHYFTYYFLPNKEKT